LSNEKPISDLIPCECFNGLANQEVDFICEFGPWVLMLNHQQNFLGRTLAILKRHAVDFGEITPHELIPLLSAYRHWKAAIDKAFKPDKYNLALLGNEEYLHGGHVHFHFVPRYRRPVTFASESFQHDTPETTTQNYSRVDRKQIYPIKIRRKIKHKILRSWPKHLAIKK